MAKGLTIRQLENTLRKRKLLLDRLKKRRDRLLKELSQLEKQIAEVGGNLQGRRRKSRRPRNSKTLLTAVTETLAKRKKGLTLKDLAKTVLDAGYKTSSRNFENTLYQTLYHNSATITHDHETRTYSLRPTKKKSPPIRQRVAARTSRQKNKTAEKPIQKITDNLVPVTVEVVEHVDDRELAEGQGLVE